MISGGFASAIQVGFSLLLVVGVIFVAAKLARRAGVKGPGAGLRVLDRAGLSREASVAVVEIDGRRLVVGVTPHGVNLLTDLSTAALPALSTAALPAPADHATPGDHATAAALTTPAPAPGDLTGATPAPLPKPRPAQGSVLAPATWKQGVEALRELTARKG